MAAPITTSDLTLMDAADAVGNYSALGGGAGGLSDETDYFIETPQCVSKAGFTATTKGHMTNTGTHTVTSGDAIFIWAKQNNRNLMDTVANGGMQFVVGNGTADYDHFYVDGSNSEGSDLAGWRTYAIDPTQTPSTTTGTPTTTDRVGFLWKILGSGSLKGNPNGIDISRHGRTLTTVNGDVGTSYATIALSAATDKGSSYGILTPVAGGYWFHGHYIMGAGGASVDFRDADRNIIVLDDEFLPAGFNEFSIVHASSNVEWTNFIIQHLGANCPTVLTFDIGTFTGVACQFNDCSTTVFNSSSTCQATWTGCAAVTAAGADLTGSSILTPNVSANTSGLIWNVNTDTTGLLDDMTFTKTSGVAHHAIEFGTSIPTTNITLNGCNFGTDFSAGLDTTVGDETFHFLDTTGTITLNLVGCTGNKGYRSEGVVVTIVDDPVTTQYTVTTDAIPPVVIEGSRVFLEASDATGPAPFEEAVTIVQTAGVATVTHTAHGIPDGTSMVIRGATQNGYNKTAVITWVSANSYTYPVDSGTVSPATGSPICSGVIIHDTTNVSGIVSDVRVLSSAQPFKGTIRDSSGSPYYQAATVAGTVSNTAGFTATVALLSDE